METRIYVIEQKGAAVGGERRLVEATSQAQAIRYCAQNAYSALPAKPKDVATLLSSGVIVEKATELNTTN